MTAAVTFVTAPGGDPNDFNSVRFALLRVFKASCKARKNMYDNRRKLEKFNDWTANMLESISG